MSLFNLCKEREVKMLLAQEPNALMDFLALITDFIYPLIAVVIGAMLAWIPLRWQLHHDSKERERERMMSLRRDVYLSAAHKIGQLLGYLTNFFQTNESTPEGYYEAIQQIQIIGSDETIMALNQFNDHIVKAFLELIPQKDEINLLEDRGNLVMSCIKGAEESVQEIKKRFNEFTKIFDEKTKLTYELAGKCQQKTQLAEELLTPVVVAIRKELNTAFDEDAYRAMMKVSHNKWKENVEKHIASMKDRYKKGMLILLKDANISELSPDTNGDPE